MINKRQEKELADLIDESVFEKSQFDVTNSRHTPNGKVFKNITFKGTPYHFYIEENRGSVEDEHTVELSPIDIGMVKRINDMNWESVIKSFKFWLKNLKEELEVKDIWTSINENKELFKIDNWKEEDFTKEELRLLELNIDEINKKVQKEESIPEDKKILLGDAFNYLKRVAKRVKKVDWVNIAVGVLATIFLTPENFNFVLSLFAYIFSGKFLQ